MKNRFIEPVLLCVFSTVLSVPAVSASLVISELFYDASGTDAGQVPRLPDSGPLCAGS